MFSVMMVGIALSILGVSQGFCGDPCSDVDVRAISKILKGDVLSGASIVSKEPIEDLGLCEVILQTQSGQYLPCYVGWSKLSGRVLPMVFLAHNSSACCLNDLDCSKRKVMK